MAPSALASSLFSARLVRARPWTHTTLAKFCRPISTVPVEPDMGAARTMPPNFKAGSISTVPVGFDMEAATKALKTMPPNSKARSTSTVPVELDMKAAAKTMPPNFKARVGKLKTFALPRVVTGGEWDVQLGQELIRAWRTDGILQITMDDEQSEVANAAFAASKRFFSLPQAQKAKCVDDQSFAGYIASGEEITANIADYSEIFTVTKDLPLSDERVQAGWPCHGPCPWPSEIDMQGPISRYMSVLGEAGQKLLQLICYGLGLTPDTLLNYTEDGWHHLRILRFPQHNRVNGKGKAGRGIGSHTDYGLLVIAAQDHVGGLFIRPPYQEEQYENWSESTAGKYEDDDKWVYVPPVKNVFTVFPGDMMQFITSSYLPSTPHKVGLNTGERFAFAYFHEPNFRATIQPLDRFRTDSQGTIPKVHYGTHFTNMFMRNYPERITAERIRTENRMALLETDELRMST